MNTIMLITPQLATASLSGGGLQGLLIGFLILIVVLAIIGGLIWAIEQWILKGALPNPVRLVIALILVILVIIWGISAIGGGH